tara:strand:+ start:948 stop:1115 length:168 start_codon:yes stop_codon:yes gene_type:complete
MNDTEKKECQNMLGTSEGVTMEDYFTLISIQLNKSVSFLKKKFKECYPDVSDWSF